MAVIRSGVLGNTRGKVAGVVGSQWKDKNYLREYVKPANPNTTAQQVQRGKMQDCVAFAKTLVGPIFNTYTDKFQKSMSGFNAFIKSNISEFDGSVDYSALQMTIGKLYPIQSLDGSVNTGDGVVTLTWDEAIGNNGALTDKVYAFVYHSGAKLWYFASAESTRDYETTTVQCKSGVPGSQLEAWVLAIKYSGTVIEMISNSSHKNLT